MRVNPAKLGYSRGLRGESMRTLIRRSGCIASAAVLSALLSGVAIPAGAQLRTCGTRSTQACAAPDSFRFAAISAGQAHTCALTRDGVAWCWGDGRKGALGDSKAEVQRWPQRVMTAERFVEIGAGGDFTCARTASGAVYCWGNERPVPGWPNVTTAPVLVATSAQATTLTVGRRHACLLDANRQAHCWGFNVDGETGTGSGGIDAAMIPGPKLVMGDHRFQSISAGVGATCGVRADGVLLCWGSNIDGVAGSAANDQCGDVAAVRCSTTPVPVDSTRRWKSVSTGTRHACAVDAEGLAHCWGTNDVGQVGAYNERRTVVNSPIRVALPNARLTSIHSGGIHTCAISDQRRLYCWGADAWTYTDPRHYADELVPRQPIPQASFSAVSTGPLHVCALETSGRARCWGDTILGAFGIR